MATTGSAHLGAVDLHCEPNNTEHHTEEIGTERLIVRRGQAFRLSVEFKRPAFVEDKDQLKLFLDTGPSSSEAGRIRIEAVKSTAKRGKWTYNVEPARGILHLTVCSPANACIGLYKMQLLFYPSGGEGLQQVVAGTFYLLFNPWCKEDSVYLADKDLREEYVLNENGIVYRSFCLPLLWNFGQFEKDVIDICFEILDNSLSALKEPSSDALKRCDPSYISRILTAMVNSNDDKGVLSGRWDGEYDDGTPPTKWNGSLPILRKWSSTGAERVRYGQCWVFAAVACTVLRCLGIPTRCVTNYSSAHDCDGNLKVDHYFKSDDCTRTLPSRKDSVWNYHCWVESWMTRPDLPSGFDGWQVLDPTPQERSDGIFCCGPCPVKAIKEGHLDINYDAVFIFAEVNADVVYWFVNKDGTKRELSVKQNQVGTQIVTKSAFSDKRECITLNYKYPEGSKEERDIYNHAGKTIQPTNTQYQSLKVKIKQVYAVLGSDFSVYFEIANYGFVDKDIHMVLSATAVTYSGAILKEFCKRSTKFMLKAASEKKEVLRLRYEDYGDHLSEHNLIRLTAMLLTEDMSEVSLKEKEVVLKVPQLAVKVDGEPILHKKLAVQIKFVNPLPIPLTRGVFSVEGSGLTDLQQIESPKATINVGEEVVVTVTITPTKTGLRKLIVDFDSNRLRNAKGFANIIVSRA
ncbi:protein-glutamine gamma-glutamyltransferase 2 [Leucoraja erinacea]|uniref:protein-glutamine gamma-glutamyltransferase 2 n=1 Tax=Leucoraja erinaceus TaxID=7782 RepID=UPI002453F2C5|nr:protein-glutamine gamma-glutamyltransferase 2 [Leucoraja erinacea]